MARQDRAAPTAAVGPEMAADATQPTGPATSLLDPRVVQIMSTEHWSLLSARTLAYNEAFTRGGMFLSFLSMSFVALALLAQVMSLEAGLGVVAIVVLGFDVVVGLTTYGRIIRANYEDYLAVRGMARIRHAYGEIAPVVLPYFVSSTHDDLRGVMVSYGSPPPGGRGSLIYALTTSSGMVGLIVSMLTGGLGLIVALVAGLPMILAAVLGVAAGLAMFGSLVFLSVRYFADIQNRLSVMFPSPPEDADKLL